MRFSIFLCVLLAALTTPVSGAYASEPSDKVPPGFENLDVVRPLVLDMYVRGKKVGSVLVSLSGRTFRFQEPENVAALLPIDGVGFPHRLDREFASNVDLVCSRLSSLNCGNLQTADLAFIIDEENFRVDAFINDDHLDGGSNNSYLRPTYGGASITTVLDGSVSGINGSADYYVQSESILSFGELRAIGVGAVSSYDSVLAREASIELDHGSLRSKAGLYWTPTNDFLGRRRLIGLGTQSQDDTLPQREQDIGTPLQVALPERSRVDVFDGDRLLWTGFFPAGFASIDTRGFPDGAYPVTIQITTSSGEKREEPRFFVKDNNLPAVGKSKFHAFLGLLGETIDSGTEFNEVMFTAGYTKRASNSMAIGGSVLVTEQVALAEFNLDFATERMRSRTSVLAGSSGQIGVSSTFSLKPRPSLTVNLTGRKLWSRDGRSILPSETYDAAAPFPNANGLHLTGGYTQIIASISQRIAKGNLRLHAIYTDTPDSRAVYSVGPAFDYPILSGPAGNLQFSANAIHSNGDSSTFVGIRFFKSTGTTAFSGRAGLAHESQNRNLTGMRATDMVGDFSVSSRTSIGAYDVLGSAGFSREFYGHDARAEVDIRSQIMAARGSILQNINGASGQTQYAASFRTAMGASKQAVVLAGRNYAKSALSIEIDAPVEAEFDVLIDDRLVGKAFGRKSFAVFLAPYKTYEVSIRNASQQAFKIEGDRKSVTLFPGNVAEVEFTADIQFTLFGRLLDKSGVPIANEMIRSKGGIGQSDANGFFQIETLQNDLLTVGTKKILQCELPASETDTRAAFRKVGDILCD